MAVPDRGQKGRRRVPLDVAVMRRSIPAGGAAAARCRRKWPDHGGAYVYGDEPDKLPVTGAPDKPVKNESGSLPTESRR